MVANVAKELLDSLPPHDNSGLLKLLVINYCIVERFNLASKRTIECEELSNKLFNSLSKSIDIRECMKSSKLIVDHISSGDYRLNNVLNNL